MVFVMFLILFGCINLACFNIINQIRRNFNQFAFQLA